MDDFASYPFITPVVYLLTETFGLDLTENFFMPISFSGFVVDSLVVFVSKLLMLAVAVVPWFAWEEEEEEACDYYEGTTLIGFFISSSFPVFSRSFVGKDGT